MKETVIFNQETGDVLAVIGEYDTTKVRVETFEVATGYRVDRIDVSGEKPVAITNATPASLQAELEAQILANKEAIAAQDKKLLDAINVLMGGEE